MSTAGTGGAAPPPEVEVHVSFELPHAGERHVYVANPDTDNIAVIDAETLGIHIVEAGDGPRFLQTLAGRDSAIVLNVLSEDATIVRTENGVSTTSRVEVLPGSNAIAVSPNGSHAVAYFDAAQAVEGARTGSFQDVTVISLSEGEDSAVGMTVGFRPSQVQFSSDGERAFVITEDGVSILDFAEIKAQGPTIARTVPVAETTLSEALDVSVTEDGSYALARESGKSIVRLVELATGDIKTLELASDADGTGGTGGTDGGGGTGGVGGTSGSGGNGGTGGTGGEVEAGEVTDLDLAPSGDFALAVLRKTSSVLRIPIPEAFDDPNLVETITLSDEVIGSVTVTPDSERALLYTTAVDDVERMSVLDLASGSYRGLDLRKGVRGVTVSPDNRTAFVIHAKLPGDPTEANLDPDLLIDRSYAYSVVRLEDGFAKLQITDSEVGPAVIVPDGSALFALFNGPVPEVQRVDLTTFIVHRLLLGSPPVSVGAVPGSEKVFVGQEHPDGRITFIDWNTGQAASVTGFELNSRIRE